MKVCQNCGDEIATPDGENECTACADACEALREIYHQNLVGVENALYSLGLVRVEGICGGIYWE